MNHRILLFLVLAAAIISTAQLVSLIASTSPYALSESGMRGFYATAFVALSTVLGLATHGVRSRVIKARFKTNLSVSLRQSALFSLVILLTLFFNSLGILSVWDIIPLIAAATLIEFFFQAEKRPRARLEYEE